MLFLIPSIHFDIFDKFQWQVKHVLRRYKVFVLIQLHDNHSFVPLVYQSEQFFLLLGYSFFFFLSINHSFVKSNIASLLIICQMKYKIVSKEDNNLKKPTKS